MRTRNRSGRRSVTLDMGERPPDDEVRLALALAAAHGSERRLLPDRRFGLNRRKERMLVSDERRAGGERRRQARRKDETQPTGL